MATTSIFYLTDECVKKLLIEWFTVKASKQAAEIFELLRCELYTFSSENFFLFFLIKSWTNSKTRIVSRCSFAVVGLLLNMFFFFLLVFLFRCCSVFRIVVYKQFSIHLKSTASLSLCIFSIFSVKLRMGTKRIAIN